MSEDLMRALADEIRRLKKQRDIEAEVRALGVCKHEDCPYPTPEGAAECGNHEKWMT